MNVQDKIQGAEREIATLQAMVKFLEDNRAFLESVEGSLFESCGTIHFTAHGKMKREQALSIIRHFHGKWDKTYDQDRVSYERQKGEGEVLAIGIYEAEAPASCRIEEVEEEVPAHKIIRRRLVCTERVEVAA